MNRLTLPRPSLHILALIVGAFGVALAVSSSPVSAAENITLSPTSVKRTVDGGDKTAGSLTVINDSDAPNKFKVYVAPYNVKGEDYTKDFTLRSPTDASTWISVKTTEFSLDPNGKTRVDYELSTPANAAPGGYYAALFVETQPSPNGQTGIAVHKRVGALFYIRVNGDVIERGAFESWTTAGLQTTPPLTSRLRISNSGNVHYTAIAKLKVADIFNSEKAAITVEREILPNTTRAIDIIWDTSPSWGLFKVSGEVQFLGQTHKLSESLVLIASLPVLFGAILIVLLACVITGYKLIHAKK